ncbi:hypothetical protein GMOD_00005927 [Pyrenophora seminiperda CCB06]|uniref:Uncharacterized protein n=1 Tax=Pyrenophora seminiperda CCB06 TaxID=1302712 RepID=A0A3M7MAI1_9PLEO|nr:hypothetical protein GMOD_00005927 [Pyrenophora seminiperda CCB06]
MSFSVEPSRYRKAVKDNQAKMVAMNNFDCAVFSRMPGIGTDDLGACSVVLIVSSQAAIIGHIPPLPTRTHDPHAGDSYVNFFMDRLIAYYRQCQSVLTPPDSLVVCAVYKGVVALQDQQRIMVTKLREAGIPVNNLPTYTVPMDSQHRDRGTIYVDARGAEVEVYVEDVMIKSIPITSPFSGGAEKSHWHGQHHIMTRIPALVCINWCLACRTAYRTRYSRLRNRAGIGNTTFRPGMRLMYGSIMLGLQDHTYRIS